MVVDSSAIVAILTRESGWEQLAQALDEAESVTVSAASVLETAIVVESHYGEIGRQTLDEWLSNMPLEIAIVTKAQVEAAREGFRRYGKGRHPAGLNFGDCFSYSLAKTRKEPILFHGNDFAKTDLRSALRPPH